MKRTYSMVATLALALMLTTAGIVAAHEGEWTGTAGHDDKGAATLKVGETTYHVKAGEKADEATKKLLADKNAEFKGEVTIKGEIHEHTISATSAVAAAKH